jgi:hypothetical protein
MSRITDGPVKDGDALNAASLNDRFTSYTQTDINAFNARDASHDLPQFATGWVETHTQSQQLGTISLKHGSTTTINGMTAMPASPVAITGTMSFGAGLTIAVDEILRVYWNLSVRPDPGNNWNSAGSLGYYVFPGTGGGTRAASTWGAVWAFYLEWDITSSALAAFVPVNGQQDFTSVIGTKYGNTLAQCEATSVVNADLRYATPNQGELAADSTEEFFGFRALSGAWYYPRTGTPLTVYGLRVVCKGIMHPWSVGTANYLVHDTTYSNGATLQYTAGNLSVLKQRVK